MLHIFASGFKTEKVENLDKEEILCENMERLQGKEPRSDAAWTQKGANSELLHSECCKPSVQRKKQLWTADCNTSIINGTISQEKLSHYLF